MSHIFQASFITPLRYVKGKLFQPAMADSSQTVCRAQAIKMCLEIDLHISS